MATYTRKTQDVWEIWTNYGYGWENKHNEMSFKDARISRKEYRDNVPGVQVKIKRTRVKIEIAEAA